MIQRYSDDLLTGRVAPNVSSFHSLLGSSIHLVEACGHEGDLSGPATGDVCLTEVGIRPFDVTYDVGAGLRRDRVWPGQVVLIASGFQTRIVVEQAHHAKMIAISGAWVRQRLGDDAPEGLDFGELHSRFLYDAEVTAALDDLWRLVELPLSPVAMLVDDVASRLVRRLAALSGRSRLCAGQRRRPHAMAPWKLRRSLELLCSDAHETLSLDSLADDAEMSTFHFCRSFRKETGLSPYQWQLRLRMSKARTLVREGRLSMTDVATEVGYGSLAAFSKAFTRYFGVPATTLRNTLPGTRT